MKLFFEKIILRGTFDIRRCQLFNLLFLIELTLSIASNYVLYKAVTLHLLNLEAYTISIISSSSLTKYLSFSSIYFFLFIFLNYHRCC